MPHSLARQRGYWRRRNSQSELSHGPGANGRSWPGPGAVIIEIDATLLTIRLLMSMSGSKQEFRIGVGPVSVEAV